MSAMKGGADSFVINLDLRQLGDNGQFPWKLSLRNVEEFGSSFTGNGHASLRSIGGAIHLHIGNVTGFACSVDVTMTQHAAGAQFDWTLRRADLGLHRGQAIPADGHLRFETPVSDHPNEAVFGINQSRATAEPDLLWQIRNIRISGTR